MILTVASLKGGVGQTTTSVHLAAVAAKRGHAVTLIDADREPSAMEWSRFAPDLPFKVVPAEPDRLVRQAKSLKASGRVVVIDTPPNSREVLKDAALIADHVLVPVKPTGLDLNRLRPTLEVLAECQAIRDELDVAIVLTGWDARKAISREALEMLEGFPVLTSRVRHLTRYESAFGTVPAYLVEYGDVWKELTEGE